MLNQLQTLQAGRIWTMHLQTVCPRLRKTFLRSSHMGYVLGITILKNKEYSTQRKPNKHDNYYDVLSLSPKATQQQIKSAYFELSKTFHPDVNKSSEATQRFSEISEAYETLGNVGKRRMYDRQTLNASSAPYDHSHFHTPGGFRERPKTVFRGRTKIYNFDEFYRQHYDDHRQQSEDNKESIIKKKKETESLKGDFARSMFCVGVMVGMVLAVWPFSIKSKKS